MRAGVIAIGCICLLYASFVGLIFVNDMMKYEINREPTQICQSKGFDGYVSEGGLFETSKYYCFNEQNGFITNKTEITDYSKFINGN